MMVKKKVVFNQNYADVFKEETQTRKYFSFFFFLDIFFLG